MSKTDYHTLAPHVSTDELDGEVREKLDRLAEAAEVALRRARPR